MYNLRCEYAFRSTPITLGCIYPTRSIGPGHILLSGCWDPLHLLVRSRNSSGSQGVGILSHDLPYAQDAFQWIRCSSLKNVRKCVLQPSIWLFWGYFRTFSSPTLGSFSQASRCLWMNLWWFDPIALPQNVLHNSFCLYLGLSPSNLNIVPKATIGPFQGIENAFNSLI